MPHQMLIEEVVRAHGGDELHTVPASATVGDAVAMMAEREVGAVLVMTEDGLLGGICCCAWCMPGCMCATRQSRW
jgi:CBS domain-containing protein